MPDRRYRFGLCSSLVAAHLAEGKALNYETAALVRAARRRFEEVILLHPWRVSYHFLEGSPRPVVTSEGRDLGDLSCLMVRSTGGYEGSISVLVRALDLCGCRILDPPDRFAGTPASKLLSTVERHERGVGLSTYYAFSLSEARALAGELARSGAFPLLSKPVRGSRGRGVRVLEAEGEVLELARELFDPEEAADRPLLLQRYLRIQEEYRVMLVGSRCLGVARKSPGAGEVAANVGRGATFTRVEAPEVAAFVTESLDPAGVSGVDVARDPEGKLHVLEANRAPRWEEFERATGIDVAAEVIDYAVRRCDEPAAGAGSRAAATVE